MDRHQLDVEFDQFVLARAAQLRRTSYVVVRDWHAAEHVVQAVLVKLFLAWPRIRSDTVDRGCARGPGGPWRRGSRPERARWPTPCRRC